MAVFRVEKNHNYTVMSNYHLRDTRLTLKSIGLLSKMLSLTDEWDYTTRGLAAICKEGVDAIGAALKELESHGYLVRRQLMPAFHNRLHQELLDELYPTLATTITPSPYKVTQEDIDAALQQWNGRIESKHAVVRYMKAHARDRDTAAWLAREYGVDDSSKPLQISVGNSEPVTLSWAKVQRRIAQLIQSDNFYTEQEQDNFDNIDPVAIREALAERGIVGGRIVDAEANRNSPFVRQVMADVERIAAQEAQAAHMDSPDRFSIRLHPNEGGITGIWDSALDRFYEEGGQVLRFAEQSNAIDYLSSIQRSRGMEPDAPVFTTPLGNAYRVGDGFSSTAAEQRDTVRRIFSMRASGMGFRAIAVTLNEEGVLPPGALYYQRKGRSDPRNVNHKWAETTVKALIRSEVYIGNMVQGKTGTLSYKSRKLINKPEEEWIRVEGTHEPIISREVWDTVVSIDKKKVRKTPPTDGIRSIFTGLVYCADCGFKMRNHIERFTYKDGTPGRYSSFICGNYARSGKSACTIHSIYENVLEELVLTDIREKARFVECDGELLAEQISRMKEKESRSRVISYEQEMKAAAARMTELERLMQNLYEDKCTGTIPQTVFQTLMRKYETERAEKAAAIPELEQKVRAQLENRQDANRWMEIIRRYTEITALDENILFELVDRIEVGEARKVNGQRICDVKVVYRYVGSVDDALSQERLEAYEKAI